MTPLIWLNEDCLTDNHPVFKQAGSSAVAFFIWDTDYFQAMDYGYNRLLFIYEAISSLPFDIYDGKINDVLMALFSHYQTDQLWVPKTPNQYIQNECDGLAKQYQLTMVPDHPFITGAEHIIETRFFRYWNKIKKKALSQSSNIKLG